MGKALKQPAQILFDLIPTVYSIPPFSFTITLSPPSFRRGRNMFYRFLPIHYWDKKCSLNSLPIALVSTTCLNKKSTYRRRELRTNSIRGESMTLFFFFIRARPVIYRVWGTVGLMSCWGELLVGSWRWGAKERKQSRGTCAFIPNPSQ